MTTVQAATIDALDTSGRPGPPDATGGAFGSGDETWLSLFNQRRFAQTRIADPDRHLVVIARDETGRVLGGLAGVREDDVLVSGYSAPFGGTDLLRGRETAENMATLVSTVLAQLDRIGVRELRIKLAPSCYGENQPLALYTLLNHGFTVVRTELNQHIDLAGVTDVDEWLALLHRPAAKAVRRSLGADFALVECVADAEVTSAYGLLAANRARKGRRLSLSLDYVHQVRRALSPDVQMMALHLADEPVAAALVYDVAPARRLVVAWGDAEHGRPTSPMPLLAYLLIRRALADGVQTLDLGISSQPDLDPVAGLRPDPGLVQFKRSLGARAEPRFTVMKRWS